MKLKDDIDVAMSIVIEAIVEEKTNPKVIERARKALKEADFEFTDFALEHFVRFMMEDLSDS